MPRTRSAIAAAANTSSRRLPHVALLALSLGAVGLTAACAPMDEAPGAHRDGQRALAITVGAGQLALNVGESVQVRAAVTTLSERLYTLSYKASDATVATVSSDGVVTAVAAGTTTISVLATLLDDGTTASASVHVDVAGTSTTPPSTTPPSTTPLPPGGSGVVQASFVADPKTELQNPERGFYFRIQPGEACTSVLTAVRDGVDYQQKVKLAYYEVNPSSFSSSSFAADMACVRAAGMKVVLGEVYCGSLYCNEGVTIDQAEAQLAAMAPAVSANRDVIAVVRIGVMGGWGEGASWNGGDVPDAVRERVRDAVVKMAPPEIPLVHRNPMYVFQWYPVTTAATAFDGSVGSRLGIVNDCFLSGPDDHYTYPDAGLRAKTAAHTEFTPFGAEACDGAGAQSATGNRLACRGDTVNDGSPGGIMNEGPRYHLTYLHRGYFDGYMTAWGGLDDQGRRGPGDCYDDVANLMGYRFQLDAIRHPQTITRGTTATVSIDLRDVGWARIFSARKLVVTLEPRGGGSAIVASGGDARLLPSQATTSTTVDIAAAIPAGAAPGAYDVYVGMPDVWPTTAGDPRQAVRFANADNAASGQSWDDAKARMKAGTVLTVE